MKRVLVILALLLAPLAAFGQIAGAPAPGAPGAGTPHARVSLAATGPATNGRLPLALHIDLDPGWHIYWKDPGQAGIPPQITLDPPAAAGPFAWQGKPDLLVQAGLHVNVVSGDVLLAFTARDLPAGATSVGGTLRMLVCSDQLCIPEATHLAATIAPGGTGAGLDVSGLLVWIASAFLGGLILNLMPCVFPVLALKALALTRLGSSARAAVRRDALLYGAGVVLSMLVLGAILLGLRAAGVASGWGFQFQSPVFVALAGLLMLAIALNLAGAFEISLPFGFKQRGAFGTGVLAVLVATPCSVPFMAGAIAAALAAPPAAALAIFAGLGLGLASPFLLLAPFPALATLLPRPGAWMVWLRRVLSLPMFATAAWLFWVLHASLSAAAPALPPGAEAYSAARLAQLRAEGRPVLVDMTAAWCLTCQANDRVVLETAAGRALFAKNNAVLLVGDWTNGAPAITEFLHARGRDGVPLYVAYASGAPAHILPQILTPGIVGAALDPTR